ncbi:M48 family metallopeptidase [Methanocaldococcus sp. 10A]
MKYFKYIFFLLFLFVLLPHTFGVNMTVDLGNYVYLNIISDKNISSYLKNNLNNYKEIHSKFEDGKYKTFIKINWNKNEFIYNIATIKKLGNFSYKIESDTYLSLVKSEIKNNTLIVKVKPNYNITMLGLSCFIIIPLISGLFVIYYIRRLTKNIPNSVIGKININKKITISVTLHIILCAILFFVALFICNLPDIIIYFLNFGNVLYIMPLVYGSFMIMMFFPSIFGAKYYIRIFKPNEKSHSITTKTLLLLFIIIILPMTITVSILLLFLYILPNWFYNILSKLPEPLITAFWLFVGFVIFNSIDILVKLIPKKKENIENKEIYEKTSELVDELTKKLNTKKFKDIEIINSLVANAMVSGLFNEKLVITKKLIDILNEDELKAILAHEIAHKKRRHIKIGLTSWFILGVVIFSSVDYILKILKKILSNNWTIGALIIVGGYLSLYIIDSYLSRKREKEADTIASQITNPKIYIKALAKIHYANYSPEKGFLNIISTHPSMLKRAKFVGKKFGLSDEEIKKIINEARNEIEKVV